MGQAQGRSMIRSWRVSQTPPPWAPSEMPWATWKAPA